MKHLLCDIAGQVSMCWEPRPTGVFDAVGVMKIVEANIDKFPKHLEVHDHQTCVPILAIPITQNAMTRAVGYRDLAIIMYCLQSAVVESEPFRWASEWHRNVHKYIIDHWKELTDGQVIDFRVVRGETNVPCESDYDHSVPFGLG